MPNYLAGRKSAGLKQFEFCQVKLKLQIAEAAQSKFKMKFAKFTPVLNCLADRKSAGLIQFEQFGPWNFALFFWDFLFFLELCLGFFLGLFFLNFAWVFHFLGLCLSAGLKKF